MKTVRLAILVIGILAALMGLLWIAQGAGYFPYPTGSFMIDQRPWIIRGAGLGAFGLLLILMSRWAVR